MLSMIVLQRYNYCRIVRYRELLSDSHPYSVKLYVGILISNELKYNSTPTLKSTHHIQYAYIYLYFWYMSTFNIGKLLLIFKYLVTKFF